MTDRAEPPPDRRDRPSRVGWRGRLLLWFVGLLAVTTLLTALVAEPLLLAGVDERIDEQLRRDAQELALVVDGLDPRTGEPIGDDTRRLLEVFLESNLPDEHQTYVALVDGEPVLRAGGDPAARLDEDPDLVATWASLDVPSRGTATSAAGEVRWLALPVVGDRDGTLALAWFADLERAGPRGVVRTVLLLQAVVGLVLVLALGRVLTRGLSRPLATLTATTRSIQASDPSRRLPVAGDDELGELAATVNGLLDRLDHALASQRRFLGDVRDELRAPLVALRGHLDALDEHDDDPVARAEALDVARRELDRTVGRVDDLVVLTGTGDDELVRRRPVHLPHLAARLERRLSALGDRDWRVTAQDATGRLDDDRVVQAVLALADNAVRHTDAHGTVAVALGRDGRATTVRVADDGHGIAPDLVGRVFERYARDDAPDERSGLGLAVVQVIAAEHGGSAAVERTGPDGTTVLLTLPDEAP